MRFSGFCFDVFSFLFPAALIATVCLYLYPALYDCTFPVATPVTGGPPVTDGTPAEVAPFRLLALGDPQLEGDTSLPDPDAPSFPSLRRTWGDSERDGLVHFSSRLSLATRDLIRQDLPKILQGYRKRLDLWGNDLYLAHIYRSVSWWAQPTHTVVLGDLLGSQHIHDEEFKRRSERFWNVVFSGAEKVPRKVTDVSGRVEVLGADDSWRNRILAVAGNHDIGYAGDIDGHLIERFEETYGSVNWEIRFRYDNGTSTPSNLAVAEDSLLISTIPELRVIILNSMNLDGPAKDPELQSRSRDFLGQELYTPARPTTKSTGTILLTHIPLHKQHGICVDGPFFDYHSAHEGGGVKEQNHLSKSSSDYILNGLVSQESHANAIILNGHDHEGCDTYHYRSPAPTSFESSGEAEAKPSWEAKHYLQSSSEMADDRLIGVREITVRSMMGSFGGNAGLLSAWFDHAAEEWRFEYKSCMLGVQHIWWAVHVLDLVVVGLGFVGLFAYLWEDMRVRTERVLEEEAAKLKEE